MLARFRRSGARLLVGSFRCGLFENPYLDPDESRRTVGCEAHCNAGFEAQVKSLVLDTRKAMCDKPVIVSVRMQNPCVLAELEAAADAIIVDFGVQQKALLTLISGRAEPSGLLPVQLPRDMETVEAHCEDAPLDLIPYTDSVGNAYDFGFGLNWSGVIRDERTAKYTK